MINCECKGTYFFHSVQTFCRFFRRFHVSGLFSGLFLNLSERSLQLCPCVLLTRRTGGGDASPSVCIYRRFLHCVQSPAVKHIRRLRRRWQARFPHLSAVHAPLLLHPRSSCLLEEPYFQSVGGRCRGFPYPDDDGMPANNGMPAIKERQRQTFIKYLLMLKHLNRQGRFA